LANFIGTATETLIRLLKDFKEENLVKTHARQIEILDRERLLYIAGA
jgi:CRP/FNR family transcriptional regulator